MPLDPSAPAEQAEAAPVVAEVTPTPVVAEPVSPDELFAARRAGASEAEIAEMQSRLLTAPDPEPPVVAPAATEPPKTEVDLNAPTGETPPAVEDEAKVSDRLRIGHLSEGDKIAQNAINLLTRTGMPLAEATERVLGPIGKAPAAEPPAPAIPEVPEAVQVIDNEITAHKAELAKIAEERKAYLVSPEHYSEELGLLEERRDAALDALNEARIKRSDVVRNEQQQAQTHEQVQSAKQQALEDTAQVYPDLANPKSVLFAVTAAVANEVRNDPAHPDHARSKGADFIRYCAEEAAKRTRATPAAATPPAVAKPAALAPKPPGPARGSLATTPPAPPVSAEAAKKAAEERFINRRSAGAAQPADGLLTRAG